MTAVNKTQRFLVNLQLLLLFGALVESSSLSSSSHLLSVSYKVGNQAVLPCSWLQRLGREAPPSCHVQWATPSDTVFELRGDQEWQAEEFEGRAEVPRDRLGSGDCSLIITDVQVGDTGRYESFMVVEGQRAAKTRVFIQSVRLSVNDHKSFKTGGPGEDLVLDLYTTHSMRVVFYGRNSSEWSVLWMRGDNNTDRLEKDLLEEKLTVKKLQNSDEGTYKVLDEYGLTVSTVQLSVTEKSTALKRLSEEENTELRGASSSSSSCSSSALLLLLSALVTRLQILHLM
ncbi:LOW QUALITY PROTEIN: galectin 17 [Centropristis striata]|uniref:LOW QUALITY PROTEIN: galectin 17 n=1 Tax=Centropristis striata TaxID=184440 RepID=UPI0027E01DA3|nr:LOW QUALITY PROTEIN: galectin 17 [Centropristis striata]